MPYFCLLPFVFSVQYEEGQISRVITFVSVYYFFAILIYAYSLSSGIWLNIINHCFVWSRLASFHLPSFLAPCWIFCILVLLSWSLKKARLTVDLNTALKPFLVTLKIGEMGCEAEAKFVFHCICKNIEFIRI